MSVSFVSRSTFFSLCLMLAFAAVSAAQTVQAPQAAQAAQASQAVQADVRHERVDALFAPWNGTDTPGCAVGISRDGVLDYARGYGMANLDYGIAITPDSIFHVASISKQFTAFAIGLLGQEGKLSLDDDVRKHVPELPDFGHKVTLAQMLHHTAGMREEFHLLYLAGWRFDDPRNEADTLWIIKKQRTLNFTPGTEPLYTNSHYSLLATIVQRVSGMTLREFAKERIFGPLGMMDTHFQDGQTEVVRKRAAGYRPAEAGTWRVSIPRSDQYGAGNLLTTVGDLLKWQQNFVHARVGGRSLVDWMQASAKLNDGTATGYGGGLRVGDYRGARMIGHDGADAGYRADMVSFPERGLSIVALCNSASMVPGVLTRKIADVYLGDLGGDRLTSAPPVVNVPPSELSALAGTYWSAVTDEVVRLELKDGALRVVGSTDPLVPIGDGLFHVNGPTGSTSEYRFSTPAGPATPVAPAKASAANASANAPSKAPAKAPAELRILDAWPVPRVFTRLTKPVPSATALAALAGQYRSNETEMTYTARVENGKLTLRWGRSSSFALTLEPIGGDHFIDGIWSVTFTRSPSGDIDALTITTRRLRRLRATRVMPS